MTAALPLRVPAAALVLPAVAPAVLGALRTAPAFLGRWAVRLLVAVAVLTFAVLAAGPHLLGYRTMTMLTSSMAPGIEPGDVVISTPLAVADVTEGMVISYHIPIDDHRVVTHRVIDVTTTADGAVAVQTKGDANDHPDPWTAVLKGDTAYQVQAVIPAAGHLIAALRTPWVSQLTVYGATTLLAGWLLLGIWRPTADAPTADAAPSAPRPALTTRVAVVAASALLAGWLLLGISWPAAESVPGTARPALTTRLAVLTASALLAGWLVLGPRPLRVGAVTGRQEQQ